MRRRYRRPFDFAPTRRREIERYAKHIDAAHTDDFPRFLIAWAWHNPKSTGPVWALMNCAERMGGKISEAEASAILEEASITRKHLSADNLARFLGITYAQRQALHLTTIGSIDVGRRARKELRKRRDRMAKEAKRRACGLRPQSGSLSATQPWREEGMSRATWYRQNKARIRRETTLSAAIFLSSEDKVVSPKREEGPSEGRFAPKEGRGSPSSQTAATMAVDRLESLPVELRLMALCLPMPENLARAA